MCGICGFAGFDDAALLRRMTAALCHRGPDSDGFFTSADASLGFRRLSIIDLEGGQQPLANEDGSLRLILHGEIYNYRAPRALRAPRRPPPPRNKAALLRPGRRALLLRLRSQGHPAQSGFPAAPASAGGRA